MFDVYLDMEFFQKADKNVSQLGSNIEIDYFSAKCFIANIPTNPNKLTCQLSISK